MGKQWTKEDDKQLLKLIGKGLVFTEIAAIMGITKNSAIGRSHRLRDKNMLPEPKKKAPLPVKVVKQKPKPAPKPAIVKVVITPKPMQQKTHCTLLELTPRSCRYAVKEIGQGEYLFCGEQSHATSPYCKRHHEICYTPARKQYK